MRPAQIVLELLKQRTGTIPNTNIITVSNIRSYTLALLLRYSHTRP